MSYQLDHEPEADTWVYTWPDFGVGVGIEQIVDRRDGLWCEITIQQLAAGEALHLHGPVRLNLVSTTGHDSLMKHLASKTNGAVPWGEVIEIACARTAKEYRKGAPPIVLADVVVPRGGLPYMIWPMLPLNETTLLFGAYKSLKSTLALALGVYAAQGIALPFMRKPDVPATVIYCDWESEPDEHAEHLEFICRGLSIPKPRNIYYVKMYRGIREDRSRLKEMRRDLKANLMIYDSLAGACADDMKEQSVATSTIGAMRDIGGTRLMIGHKNREEMEKKEGPSHVFGSVFFDAYARSIWEIEAGRNVSPEGKDPARIIGLFHRNVNRGMLIEHPLMLGVSWWTEEGAIKFIPASTEDDRAVAGHATLDFRIREALSRGGRTALQIAEVLGDESAGKVKSISTTLSEMHGVIRLRGGTKGDPTVWGLTG